MKIRFRPAWLCWLGLFLATGVWAQSQSSGTITSAQCVTIATPSAATVGIQVTGTFTGTLQPEVSIQGQAAANVQVTPSTSTTAQSTITATGVYTASVAGASTFLVCGNTVASGTATVYLNASTAVRQAAPGSAGTVTASGSPVSGNIPKFTSGTNIAPAAASDLIALWSGCSGTQYLGADGACHNAGGTVTSVTFTGDGTVLSSTPSSAVTTTGTLTAALANAAAGTVLGNTTGSAAAPAYSSNIVQTQGTITTSTPVFSHTATWNAGGVAFTNWLSNITCTAAATASIAAGVGTAGTQWQFKYNAANCGAPAFISPVSNTAPVIQFAAVNGGFGFDTLWGTPIIWGNATARAMVFNGASQVIIPRASGFIWATNIDASSARDTGLTSPVAKMVSVGDSTAGNETGFLRVGNSCSVVGDITLTVNTAITVCQWSLPALAKSWSWQCKIPWVISAGSGTNTISIGVNASQTPAATTTASATILSTNTGTQTNATVNLSASGAVNVLTSGTITPAATVFQSDTFGTLSANAAAGTFTVTMTAAGTTATALAKAGATCYLY